jgi:hypothetical protein
MLEQYKDLLREESGDALVGVNDSEGVLPLQELRTRICTTGREIGIGQSGDEHRRADEDWAAGRIAEAMGEEVRKERERREAVVLSGCAEIPSSGAKRLYVGIDGTCVLTRGGGWREAKTGVIYETEDRDEEVIHSVLCNCA